MGAKPKGDVEDLGHDRHLEVEPGADGIPKPEDVAVDDVATVLAEVSGDAMGACILGGDGSGNGVRLAVVDAPVARLTKGGDVVDINAELEHGWQGRRCELQGLEVGTGGAPNFPLRVS